MSAEPGPRTKALYQWVEKNIPEEKWKDSGKTVQEACLWVCAVDMAEGYRDYTVKDFAEMLQGGMDPLNEADVEEWLEEFVESDDPDDLPRGVIPILEDFWR